MVDYRDIKRQLPQPVITFTTDFRLSDESVGAMEVNTAKLCPRARFFHNTHGARNVKEGAWLFWSYLHYTPNGSHVAVVDPGVGTERRALVIELTRKDSRGEVAGVDYLIGPDNGLLIPALDLGEVTGIADIDFDQVAVDPISPIFHGRDIFGPAAAYLADPFIGFSQVGKNIVTAREHGEDAIYDALQDLVKAPYKEPGEHHDFLSGELIRVDEFGNVFTNIPLKWVEEFMGYGSRTANVTVGDTLKAKGKKYEIPLGHTFASVDAGKLVMTDNAYRQVQIAVNQGDAAERLGYLGYKDPKTGKKTLNAMVDGLGEEKVPVTIEVDRDPDV